MGSKQRSSRSFTRIDEHALRAFFNDQRSMTAMNNRYT